MCDILAVCSSTAARSPSVSLFLLPLSQSERHFIMQVVCEATQCNSVPVSW